VCLENLVRLKVGAVYVTPAHQYPNGSVLSAARRTALLAWAAKRDVFVIEDDYDGEYRYDREPIGALQGLSPERVIYIG
jgi:GntR family transcriptional regulator/MocR family aminotransferase